ncbi:hypothetical protein PG989_016604 [Apiospora arundinis]
MPEIGTVSITETTAQPDAASNASATEEKPMTENPPVSDPVDPGDVTDKQKKEAPSDAQKADDEEVEAPPPSKDDVDPRSKVIRTASLWCPETMRKHSSLLDFNIFECPECHQNLYAMKARRDVGSVTSTDTSPEDSDDGSSSDEDDEPEAVLVVNTVDMRDTHDDCIDRTPWRGTFDLQEARKNLVHSNLAFEVVTVLETSVLGTRGHAPGTFRAPTRSAANILDNATIDVEVRHTTITIHSRPLVGFMKSVVSYYPGLNLNGNTVRIAEPFAILVHHYSQLETFLAKPDDSTAIEEPKTENEETKKEEKKKNLVNRQLESLLQFVKQPKYDSPILEEIERNSRGVCTFRMLWYMLRPGSTVYLSRDGRLSAMVISQVEIDERILRPEAKWMRPYEITLWYLDFDGRHVGRSEETVSIPAFEGERLITSLRLFPVEYRDSADGGKTKRELEEMGKRWFSYLHGSQAHYSGEFIGPLNRLFNGRVYIDNAAYVEEESSKSSPPGPQAFRGPPPMPPGYRSHRFPGEPPAAPPSHLRPGADKGSAREIPAVGNVDDLGEGLSVCSCDDCRGKRVHPPPGFQWAAYDLIDPKATTTLEMPEGPHGKDHRYMLCSHRLFGFVFKSRKWEVLNVKFCTPARIQPGAIRSLVMPEDRKIMIQALVEQYNTATSKDGSVQRKQWGADFIESKGDGQIFLLHGGPGVGKSFTAGKLQRSEFTGRPLLSLNVGDIGTSEEKVEQRLSYWFNLAEKWGAVMLIDEADIYLERRSVSDLKRNGIVSVFLRCMEYYRGILFLTTNRVGQFDDAFMSRIHLIIHYEPLGDRERHKIWTQFFEKLENERSDIAIASRARNYVLNDPEITNVKWNGREIRNAFQTAVALADYQFSIKENRKEYETAQLDQKHFQQICGMALQFKGYLNNLHGMDEQGRAFVAKARIDESVD